MAALHACCFAHPRPWSETEFRELLDSRGVFALTRPQGFLLGRVILDEAELLTLAVAPEARRQGFGAALTTEFAAEAQRLGAATAFLEVASDNAPAQALYQRQGWVEAGRRRNYYAPGIDGLTLRLGL
ncbi:ribosomal-protein-alanine acetyltransferase [Paracoccus zhejiangensis]|uniref:Ribosomal-protein-alanine acetyltransferase n=2 Tax=Paracoccus zhejiangensis TaxID=1077935 RepID=A0A2H5F302_9RHOB|nr:ribosomal-protein-alanine acetyltransferase [Paracoccus zhejiangensis]